MYSQKEVEKALADYKMKFGEGFPTFYFYSNGDIDGLIKEIRKAIRTGKPYEPKLKEDAVY